MRPTNAGTATAAANLSNALNAQAAESAKESGIATGEGGNDEYAEVTGFLNSIALDKYKDRFIENGIEDQETILELNDEHLDAL